MSADGHLKVRCRGPDIRLSGTGQSFPGRSTTIVGMLHEFLAANRQELIRRCVRKASKRDLPRVASSELEHGIPLFVGQLVTALRCEQADPVRRHSDLDSDASKAVSAESSRTAALHGKALLEEGYSVDQLVHGYGDVRQSVTELAKEKNALITVEEFHTLNRLLDNAIADAVVAYGRHRDQSMDTRGDQSLHDRMGTLAEEQRQLLNTALKALDALKLGNIGLMGATGSLLQDSLVQLRDLIDKSLPQIRLSSGMTTPSPAGEESSRIKESSSP
jgi:hypothetical protein